VTRYRTFLEQAYYASSTINLRLAAVRRLAYEAADAGLLSPDLAAGIRRVKGAKKHGVRMGNWLTAEQGRTLPSSFDQVTVGGKRDYAMVAVLLGCGLRRAELAAVQVKDVQQREEHWYSQISWEREDISELFRCPAGLRQLCMPGWRKLLSRKGLCSVP
jgi:integrase